MDKQTHPLSSSGTPAHAHAVARARTHVERTGELFWSDCALACSKFPGPLHLFATSPVSPPILAAASQFTLVCKEYMTRWLRLMYSDCHNDVT